MQRAIQVLDVTEPVLVQQLTGAIVKREQGVFLLCRDGAGKGRANFARADKSKANRAAKVRTPFPGTVAAKAETPCSRFTMAPVNC